MRVFYSQRTKHTMAHLMAHLLIIENRVEDVGRLFPKAVHDLAHRYTFITRQNNHNIDEKNPKIHPVFADADNVLSFETNVGKEDANMWFTKY